MYDRVREWKEFADQVALHIEQYTLPQYGSDSGTEQIDEFTLEDCFQNLMRYVNRRRAEVRGPREKIRDAIKIAHYASFIYSKLRAELGIPVLYAPRYEPDDEIVDDVS